MYFRLHNIAASVDANYELTQSFVYHKLSRKYFFEHPNGLLLLYYITIYRIS